MKNKLLLSFLLFGYLNTSAQVEPWCGTDSHFQSQLAANPELSNLMHEQLARINAGAYPIGDREDYIIPVVVHVLHDNGVGDISNEQILSGIEMLNEDYNRTNDDATDTRSTVSAPFATHAATVGIRFELAKIDPDGNCTNGIQRRNMGSRSYNAEDNAKHYASGGLDAWNRNFYFNIWIVNSIQSDGAGTILGYAEFPYGGGSSNYGVIIRNDSYGKIGTASGDRTLSHEVGHCLGLLHTFQGGCHSDACDDNGDYCCDTPPASEPLWSCSPTENSCGDIPVGDTYGFDALDQFENFMSYSPCQNMFSEDQKNIILGNLTSIGFLINLVDPAHHDETGVGLPETLCKAQFKSDNPVICAGGELNFVDDSYANVTGWLWTFEGGTPATSTAANPTVSYEFPGIYTVTLQATDGVSFVNLISENYVTVLSNPGTGLPYSQNFESLTEIPDGNHFLIVDEDEDVYWELSETVGYSGTQCAFLDNRGNISKSRDELISGTIDLSTVDPDDAIIFNFKYAYKKRNASNDEWLRFYISKDCGETWALRKNIHGDDLSELVQNAVYIPASQDEWVQVDITNIFPDYYTANFQYKFQFVNDNGNNIYIDDINMYTASMATLTEEKELTGARVYPNPITDQTTVEIDAIARETYTITVYNLLGEMVQTVYFGELNEGLNLLQWDASKLTTGVYMLRIESLGSVQTIKVICE